MKTTSVLNASTIRSFKPRLFDGLSVYELVDAVKERYQFRGFPTEEKLQTQPQLPTSFLYGKVSRQDRIIVIDQLLVTYLDRATSIGVNTKSSTDDADFFLDDLMAWAKKRYPSIDFATTSSNFYHSQLEVVFDKPLSNAFKQTQKLGQTITKLLRRSGYERCADFEVAGFSMHIDNSKGLVPVLPAFSIERRVGAPYEENKYFSQAPLGTKDHESVLEELEQILAV
jgi:hypothetical protein